MRRHSLTILLALTLTLALLALPAVAQDKPVQEKPVQAQADAGGVLFTPAAEYEYFELRVSTPDGDVLRQSDTYFSLGEAAAVDGTYVWEARVALKVDPAELAELEALRGDSQLIDDHFNGRTQVVSGAFTIKGGALVDDSIQEVFDGGKAGGAIGTKDQQILDDLIVQGSVCAGFDCVNGESFGFDTIRMKENNLRLHAQDTSNSASFPSNDWRLSFNDTTNGGKNKFFVEDVDGGRTPFTIEASAPSNSLYVEDGGRIGVGTATPVVEMHIVNGDSPTVRLEQDGSSGFTPQTWDMAGNETNWFVRDATNGSPLPLRIRPSAPQNSIYIDTDGDVGLKTQAPAANLHVEMGGTDLFVGDGTRPLHVTSENETSEAQRQMMQLSNFGGVRFTLRNTNGPNWDIASENGVDGGDFVINVPGVAGTSTGTQFRLATTGAVTIADALTQNSDVNAKQDFVAIDSADVLRKVAELPLTTWSYKYNTEVTHLGPMAQDFFGAFGLGGTDKGVQPSNMAGVALAAIQGLNAEIEAKDAQIEDLSARVAALEAMIQKLAADAD